MTDSKVQMNITIKHGKRLVFYTEGTPEHCFRDLNNFMRMLQDTGREAQKPAPKKA